MAQRLKTGKGRKAQPRTSKRSGDPASAGPHPATFPRFHSTFDIIHAAETGLLPDKIMITFHPQRWTDKPIPWVKELIWQNAKNVIKYFVVKLRSEK
jgi:hypothetical protein